MQTLTQAAPRTEEILKLRSTLNQALELYSYNKNSRSYKYILRSYAMIEIFINGLISKELKELRRQDINFEDQTIFVRNGEVGHQRISLREENAVSILKEYFDIYRFDPNDLIFPISQLSQSHVISQTINFWFSKAGINHEKGTHAAHSLGKW